MFWLLLAEVPLDQTQRTDQTWRTDQEWRIDRR